jgi:hypothetical protein
MKVWRKFAGSTWRPIARASYITNHCPRLNDRAFLNSFVEAAEMGVIMVDVVNIPDSDTPSSKTVPAFYLDNTEGDSFHWHSIIGKDIGAFMNS